MDKWHYSNNAINTLWRKDQNKLLRTIFFSFSNNVSTHSGQYQYGHTLSIIV